MRLIVLTNEFFFEGESEAIHLLFENGLERLHVRKPFASQPETEKFIEQISEIFHSRIVIHDYYELIKIFGLKGIHLNRRNPCAPLTPITNQRELEPRHYEGDSPKLSNKLQVSRSCHSLEEILESQFCDYVFLSPIFDSLSKNGYKQRFTAEQLNEAKNRKIIDDRVIALGGITTDTIPIACSYGFGGVAVLGALWNRFLIDRNVHELLERFNDLKNICRTI